MEVLYAVRPTKSRRTRKRECNAESPIYKLAHHQVMTIEAAFSE